VFRQKNKFKNQFEKPDHTPVTYIQVHFLFLIKLILTLPGKHRGVTNIFRVCFLSEMTLVRAIMGIPAAICRIWMVANPS
jgi:hypothetical protein